MSMIFVPLDALRPSSHIRSVPLETLKDRPPQAHERARFSDIVT